MMRVAMRLGVQICEAMQEAGMSREELADKIGYSYRDVCRVLEGDLLLPPSEVQRIAEVLGTTKGELIRKIF